MLIDGFESLVREMETKKVKPLFVSEGERSLEKNGKSRYLHLCRVIELTSLSWYCVPLNQGKHCV